MMMRYHWSLGIGHTYSHGTESDSNNTDHPTEPESELLHYEEGMGEIIDEGPEPVMPSEEEEPDPDDPELAMDERENEDLGPELDNFENYDDLRLEAESDEIFEMYYMQCASTAGLEIKPKCDNILVVTFSMGTRQGRDFKQLY